MSSAKRRGPHGMGSQASLGLNMTDELEMREKNRPPSSQSRNAWLTDEDAFGSGQGGDDIDFSPRAPPSAAVDLPTEIPSAMQGEPLAHQKRVTADARAPGTKNAPVGCWTRFKRIVRGKTSRIFKCIFHFLMRAIRLHTFECLASRFSFLSSGSTPVDKERGCFTELRICETERVASVLRHNY